MPTVADSNVVRVVNRELRLSGGHASAIKIQKAVLNNASGIACITIRPTTAGARMSVGNNHGTKAINK